MSPLKIKMSAREVIAAGAPFRPWAVDFSSPEVARDEISGLRPAGEALVLRVSATGGRAADRNVVAGDWLCEADGSEPARVQKPSWRDSRRSREWSKGRAWLEAWELCDDAGMMLRAACDIGVDRRAMTLAACACARTSLYLVRRDARPKSAIETAEAWARGEVPQSSVAAAWLVIVELQADAFRDIRSVRDAATYNALHAVYNAVSIANEHGPKLACDRAVGAAYDAANAVSRAEEDGRHATSTPREMAQIVRSCVPTIDVLRAATREGVAS